ncbi:hypothetical protein M0R45_006870 [Rubus argutus]|uniref:Uncharacterized protein n=1 Tax=Rubus argutus TaxID=59490 RepID=A0AAW1YS78_RUBAR
MSLPQSANPPAITVKHFNSTNFTRAHSKNLQRTSTCNSEKQITIDNHHEPVLQVSSTKIKICTAAVDPATVVSLMRPINFYEPTSHHSRCPSLPRFPISTPPLLLMIDAPRRLEPMLSPRPRRQEAIDAINPAATSAQNRRREEPSHCRRKLCRRHSLARADPLVDPRPTTSYPLPPHQKKKRIKERRKIMHGAEDEGEDTDGMKKKRGRAINADMARLKVNLE